MTNLKAFLDEQTALINVPSFIADDPVQFPRRYSGLQDIEIAAFTVATIAWGRRSMILRNAERMLERMGCSPYHYVMNGDYASLGRANVHRTFFENDLSSMLRGFHAIYRRFDSIEAYLLSVVGRPAAGAPWMVALALRRALVEADGETTDRFIAAGCEHSALKRINLALRWLVRNDGIVDLGVWTWLKPADLYIPLDVHAARTARRLELLSRKSNDRRAVEELTTALRTFCPQDPVRYDFALFGIGVNEEKIL